MHFPPVNRNHYEHDSREFLEGRTQSLAVTERPKCACLDQQRSCTVRLSGQSHSGHMPPNQLLQFPEMGIPR
jgi:hypothetical protein